MLLCCHTHTCHTSHCEIKSHRIWLFWKPNPIRFSNLKEFSDHLKHTFYKEIIINHTLLCSSQVSYIKIKAFWLFWGVPKWFLWNLTEFYQISLKILVYLTDFSPQSLACIHTGWNFNSLKQCKLPSHVAQLVTCLMVDTCLTADPGISSLVLAWSHTFK